MHKICGRRFIGGIARLTIIVALSISLGAEISNLDAEDAKLAHPTWVLKKKSGHTVRHLSNVHQLAFSTKGDYLGVGGRCGFEIWSLPEGKEIFHVSDIIDKGESEGKLWTLAFSPDGKYLVTGGVSYKKAGHPGEFVVWDIRAKQKVAFRNRHDAFVTFVGFDREGKTLVTVGGCSICSWSFPDLNELSVVRVSNGPIYGADYKPSAQKLTYAVSNLVKVWDCRTRKEVISFRPGYGTPSGPALSPNGKLVVTDRCIYSDHGPDCINPVAVWNASDGTLKTVFRRHGKQVIRFAIHPCEQLIAYIETYDNIIRLGDYMTGEEVTSFDLGLRDKLDQVSSLAFSPDGKVLAVGRGECFVQLFDLVKK